MSDIQDYVGRVLNTLWQTFLSSLSVAQVANAISNGELSQLSTISLAALGAGVAAAVSVLKNVAFKPTATGLVGLVERLAATFIEGAAAAIPIDLLTALFTGHYDSTGLRTVGLAALGGGVAAVLSLIQHTAKGLPTPTARPVAAEYPFVFGGLDGTTLAASDAGQFTAFVSALDASVLRRHMMAADFSKWIGGSLNNPTLAKAVRRIETSADGAESKRARLISALDMAYHPN